MIELSENIPFLWRLSADNEDGFCMVSMVVPFNSGNESLEHTIETGVLSFSSDTTVSDQEEVLEWNEDDISLFLKLISNRACSKTPEKAETIRVDLTDPETIEIVHVVAAAGFGMPQILDESNVQSSEMQLGFEYEIGSPVSLSTMEGYKRCIIVDLDDDEVVCVVIDNPQDDIPQAFGENSNHELLLVKRHQLVHPLYTSNQPTHLDILH